MNTRQDKYYILTTASAGRGYARERSVHFFKGRRHSAINAPPTR